MPPKLFVATKAFVSFNGKILTVRESSDYSDGTNAKKFDIVGGRMEPGQHFEESLRCEVTEETGLAVQIGRPFFVNEWRPVVRGEQWQIVGIFFECVATTDTVTLSSDHDAFAWIDPKEYGQHEIIENLTPAFEAYLNR